MKNTELHESVTFQVLSIIGPMHRRIFIEMIWRILKTFEIPLHVWN